MMEGGKDINNVIVYIEAENLVAVGIFMDTDSIVHACIIA